MRGSVIKVGKWMTTTEIYGVEDGLGNFIIKENKGEMSRNQCCVSSWSLVTWVINWFFGR